MEGDYAAQAALDIGYRILDCPSLVRSIGQKLQNPDLLPLLHLRSPIQGLHLIPRPLILLRGAVDNLKGINKIYFTFYIFWECRSCHNDFA